MAIFVDDSCSHCYPIDGESHCTKKGGSYCVGFEGICSTTPGKSSRDDFEGCRPKGTLPINIVLQSW